MKLGLAPVIAKLESVDGNALDISTLFERSFRRTLFFATVENEMDHCASFSDMNKMSVSNASAKLTRKWQVWLLKSFVLGLQPASHAIR